METTILFFALLRHAVCGEALREEAKNACTSENLEAVYALAQKHDLSHLIGHALEKLDLPDCEALTKLRTAKLKAIYRYAKMDYELECLRNIFENAHICFIPLKGSILRNFYPESWMRTSCDIDILVREVDLEAAVQILMDNGWTPSGKRGYHDQSLYSASGVHLELHFKLAENMDNIDPVLEKVWEYSAPSLGKHYEYYQSNEFFVFHHMAHMSYHMISGGCGVRSFLDLWILNNNANQWNETQLRRLCEDARLHVFYTRAKELSEVWFGNHAHTTCTIKMEEYILTGGTFGTLSNKVLMEQARTGSKGTQIWERVFQPYDQLCMFYPVLKQHKYLTPLFQIIRWFRVLLTGRMKHSIHELKVNHSISDAQLDKTKDFLLELGLSGIRRSSLNEQ